MTDSWLTVSSLSYSDLCLTAVPSLFFASQLVKELTCNYANQIILFLHPDWTLNSITKMRYIIFFSFGS